MIPKKPVMRQCISCRETYDRKNLIKITKDPKQGIMFHKGMGRSAYICRAKSCCSDSKIKKKLQKALKTFLEALNTVLEALNQSEKLETSLEALTAVLEA